MLRLDQALVERGLCESREKAMRAVMAGTVKINGQLARKPSDSVKPDDELTLTEPEKFVSRGGYKLEHALEHFHLDVSGLTAIDLGASTGGFTDCLLQHGAARVFAVDVGQGQLAWKLRRDRRVVVMEKTNARELTAEHFRVIAQRRNVSSLSSPKGGEGRGEEAPMAKGEKLLDVRRSMFDVRCSQTRTKSAARPSPLEPFLADLITIDCSFISLRKILPPAVALLRPLGNIVALVKPQFEAGKAEADKGEGVITDPAVHERVLRELEAFVAQDPSSRWRGVTASPLLGPAGNKEFLVLIEKTG